MFVTTQQMFVRVKLIYFFAILLLNHVSGSSCPRKIILFIFPQNITLNKTYFPTEADYVNAHGIKLCFNIQGSNAGGETIGLCYEGLLTTNLTLGKLICEDILDSFKIPYTICEATRESPSTAVPTTFIFFSQTSKPTIDETSSRPTETKTQFTTSTFSTSINYVSITKTLTSPTPKSAETTMSTVPSTASTTTTSAGTKPLNVDHIFTSQIHNGTVSIENAAEVMSDIGDIKALMGNETTASITLGQVKGLFSVLTKQNQKNRKIAFTSSGNVEDITESIDLDKDYALRVHLPKEASEIAVQRNSSYVGILLFPEIPKINATAYAFNNQILGIEMGVNISNLSEPIDIQFSNTNVAGFSASCVSWDGRSKQQGGTHNWITDGCETKESNGSITCQCSHLTFFAILMSSRDTRISSTDLKTLTQITKAGCGMSMFFLGVALFMHFLIRKNKASQALKILINLFIALFILNLGFLINETIANLKNLPACVVMAAVLHYSMLATFTWFFMQGLHLFFNLHKISTNIKCYMWKICIIGWVVPVLVVVGLLASNKYGEVEISPDNGTSVNMCWIPDSATHVGVNIGYYSVVFIFTLIIFIVTVVQISHFTSKASDKDKTSTKKNIFSLLGLFSLLGITWGFAFFSYGPLFLPSYYLFTILNSFQGFFLFVYYYFSSRVLPEDRNRSENNTHAIENV